MIRRLPINPFFPFALGALFAAALIALAASIAAPAKPPIAAESATIEVPFPFCPPVQPLILPDGGRLEI